MTGEKLSERLTVRLTYTEAVGVRALARTAGITPSQLLRLAVAMAIRSER